VEISLTPPEYSTELSERESSTPSTIVLPENDAKHQSQHVGVNQKAKKTAESRDQLRIAGVVLLVISAIIAIVLFFTDDRESDQEYYEYSQKKYLEALRRGEEPSRIDSLVLLDGRPVYSATDEYHTDLSCVLLSTLLFGVPGLVMIVKSY